MRNRITAWDLPRRKAPSSVSAGDRARALRRSRRALATRNLQMFGQLARTGAKTQGSEAARKCAAGKAMLNVAARLGCSCGGVTRGDGKLLNLA